ncbi:hypothetical protein IFM89_013496 [Coptis chinensis]|uniref:O-methyltransferase dimerisation domain-containing protein n=1 Tax=Coptis chinensis TaxID=261450 RepID=A0A835LF09_9MAGN|nr:hypothetical protein IFM89_013496 [Coptis chinensis]
MSSIQNFSYLTPEEEEEACLYAMQLCNAANLPMVLKAAIELDVFEIIAKFGHGDYITPSDIASRIYTNNTNAPIMLDRMLRLLASHKVLKCSLRNLDDGRVERLYGLAPVCKFFIRNEDGVSLAPLALTTMSQVFIQSW